MPKSGRPKGGANRHWSKESKFRIVKQYLDEEVGLRELCRQEKISTAHLYHWKQAYLEKGMEGLKNSRKPRNPLVKLQGKKERTEAEQLQYENMKLRIENARLKKGYTSEEVVAIRRRRSSKKNTK